MNLFKRYSEIKKTYRKLPLSQKRLLKKKKITGEFKAEELLPKLEALTYFYQETKKYYINQKPPLKTLQLNQKIKTAFLLILLIVLFFGFILSIFYEVIFYVSVFIAVLDIIIWIFWALRIKIFRLFTQFYKIQIEEINFLMPLLVLLMEETHPKSKINLYLNFKPKLYFSQKLRTEKNYLFLFYKWIGLVCIVPFVILLIWLFEYALVAFIITLVMLLSLSPFIMLGIIELMALSLGKEDKIKSIYFRVPKLNLQARLVDNTILKTNITQLIIKRRRIKKKVKFKTLRITKIKWKYKIKTAVKLQLAFSQNQYQLSDEIFRENFSKKSLVEVSGTKSNFKEKGQKKMVSYQYISTSQGAGKYLEKFPTINFKDFLNLIAKGGYNKLKGKPEKTLTQEINKVSSKENLKTEDLTIINGIGRKTEVKLNDIGFFNIQQIAALNTEEIENISQTTDNKKSVIEKWQKQAAEIISLR